MKRPPPPAVWKRDEPDSPCIQICVIEPQSKLCMGCYRSAAEIAAWSDMDAQSRASLKAELPARASQIKPQRRKRRTRNR